MDNHAKPTNPKQLVDEFKKSGEFDRLRRQLLAHFASSDNVHPLMSRVEEIVREKLSGDERLEHKTREAVHSEVMQDMERYPFVERAVNDLTVFKDDALLTSIEQYARNIVRGESNENTKLWEAKQAARSNRNEEEDNDGSSDYTEDEEPDDDDLLVITDASNKNVTSSRSPEPQLKSGVDEAVQSGRSSPPPGPQAENKPAITRRGASSPPIEMNAVNKSVDLEPTHRSVSHSSLHAVVDSHSLVGVPLSDRFSGGSIDRVVPMARADTTIEGDGAASEKPSSGSGDHGVHARPPPGEGSDESNNATQLQNLVNTSGNKPMVKAQDSGIPSLPPRP